MQGRLVSAFGSFVGAVLGGALGYFVFHWLVGQRFYALMIVGAFLGSGCNALSRERSVVRGVLCGVAALGLGLFAEWKEFPFAADESFGFMLAHFHEKAPIKIVMLLFGAFMAYWIGRDAGHFARPAKPAAPQPPSDLP